MSASLQQDGVSIVLCDIFTYDFVGHKMHLVILSYELLICTFCVFSKYYMILRRTQL